MGITRRQFLQLTGASAAGAVVFAGCSPRTGELLVESPARLSEDLVTGLDTWYASICRMCPAGCGIIARVMEGRAKKIEGNPDYPVNRGKLCARGQAGLQVLYHPDRIRGPLRRNGPRGSGQFQPISWAEALDELVGKLKPLRGGTGGRYAPVTLLTGPLRGHLPQLIGTFSRASQGLLHSVTLELFDELMLRRALASALGHFSFLPIQVPFLDIQGTRFILSFGADFLGTWLSPVQYGVAYGQFRGRPGARGFLVQVEPRMTATGASADQWIPIKPGTEGILAVGLAQVIISAGLATEAAGRLAGFPPDSPLMEKYRPLAVSQATGIPEEQIASLARRFATEKPSLALAGGTAAAHTNAAHNVEAIYMLNRLVGNVGRPGGILGNPSSPIPGVAETGANFAGQQWPKLIEVMRTGQPWPAPPPPTDVATFAPPSVLLVRGVNPAHELPPTYGFPEALEKVPFMASFSSFLDETTALADLVLPEHTYLEDWGSDIPEPAPGFQVLGFQQPVVNPLYDTRSFGDILLALAEELGLGKDLPWKSFRDVLREGARELHNLRRGSIQAATFEEYWVRLLQRGGWWDEGTVGPAPRLNPLDIIRGVEAPSFAGSEQEYPFHLLPFPSVSLGEGSGAHLPWLQATPDPITTALWGTWVEVNLGTARRLELREGDIVRVESTQGSLEGPVYPHPGIHPEVVAIPLGQGHTAFGRYAQGRGANPLSLVDPFVVGREGVLAWAATRVRLVKTRKSVRLLKAEGTVPAIELPDEDIVGVTPS